MFVCTYKQEVDRDTNSFHFLTQTELEVELGNFSKFMKWLDQIVVRTLNRKNRWVVRVKEGLIFIIIPLILILN